MPETRFVTINPKQIADVQAMLGNLGSRKFNVAMQAAIVRTQTTGVARIARRISETVNLKIADLKKQVAVKKPSFSKLVGSLSMNRVPVPLIKYMSVGQVRRAHALQLKRRGKQTRFRINRIPSGITVRVRRGGAVERYPTSFVEHMPGGHLGIFRRKAIGGKSGTDVKRVRRLPIKERMGPTAVGVLANAPGKGAQTILDEVAAELADVLQKNIASQVDRLIDNKGFGKFSSYTHE